jgi:hypothetical protein
VGARVGRLVLAVTLVVFLALCLPVVVRGSPLADDYYNCLRPQRIGVAAALEESLERLGALRRAHFLEVLVTTGACQHLPFGVAIVVPLLLTMAVALLLRGTLADVGAVEPWPSIAAAVWLLQPLGTEAALWPAALHIPLGLAASLAAVRLHRAGRHRWGTLAVLIAALSVEQVVLALPLAMWFLISRERRRPALASALGVAALVLLAFFLWPGDDPRVRVTIGERLIEATRDPAFLLRYAAVGIGAHSIPLAVAWAFPVSVAVLGLGAVAGWRLGGAFHQWADGGPGGRSPQRVAAGGILLTAALNLPVLLAVPQQGSPRVFTPTWLVIAALVGFLGPTVVGARTRPVAAAAGVFLAGAALSIALSVWVRLQTADFTVSATRQLAARIDDDTLVGVCDIRRTVVDPAPRGAFALHEFMDEGTARDSLQFHTGRRARFLIAGEPWPDRACPEGEADVTVSFSALREGWRTDE